MHIRFQFSDEAVDMQVTGTVAEMETLIRRMASVGYASFALDADTPLEAKALRPQLALVTPRPDMDIEVKEDDACEG
ncbi:MAG: hypothetical protein ACYC9Q_09040 [Bacillota bacterium]